MGAELLVGVGPDPPEGAPGAVPVGAGGAGEAETLKLRLVPGTIGFPVLVATGAALLGGETIGTLWYHVSWALDFM